MRLTAALILLLATPAAAQDVTPLQPGTLSSQGTSPAIGFTLRGGVAATPEYSGSDDVDAGADIGFRLNYLRLGDFTVGDPDPLYVPTGLSVGGSLRYISDRTASESPELEGLEDVDDALELGVSLGYATELYRVYGAVRYGVVGHESWVGELGADVFARPSDRLTLRAGPRAFFGDDDYSATYYGVTAAEADASNFEAFDADGGLISTGVEVGAGYRINNNWGVDAAITYERLRSDAADSPITANDDQFSARIGLTRRFTLGF